MGLYLVVVLGHPGGFPPTHIYILSCLGALAAYFGMSHTYYTLAWSPRGHGRVRGEAPWRFLSSRYVHILLAPVPGGLLLVLTYPGAGLWQVSIGSIFGIPGGCPVMVRARLP